MHFVNCHWSMVHASWCIMYFSAMKIWCIPPKKIIRHKICNGGKSKTRSYMHLQLEFFSFLLSYMYMSTSMLWYLEIGKTTEERLENNFSGSLSFCSYLQVIQAYCSFIWPFMRWYGIFYFQWSFTWYMWVLYYPFYWNHFILIIA